MPAQRPWLVIVAAPREIGAVLRGLGVENPKNTPDFWVPIPAGHAEIVRAGVGKWAAAGAVARCYRPGHHAGVLSVGVAGALPGAGLDITDAVLADPSLFADEGVRTPEGFSPLSAIGFPEDDAPVPPDPDARAALGQLVDRVGPVATVSACSGRDDLARETAQRTGAIAEAMEGAAAAHAARRADPDARFAELRVVSNTTGDRAAQRWELDRALDRLAGLLGPGLDALAR